MAEGGRKVVIGVDESSFAEEAFNCECIFRLNIFTIATSSPVCPTFGSRLGHSHPPAKHEGPRLCIYVVYMWTLAHMLQLGAVYYGASKFMYV